MFELIKSGGIMMFPLILSSIIALAIIIERFMSLRVDKVVPPEDIERARKLAGISKLADVQVDELRNSSLMGRVLATGLESRELPRHIMKENVEEAGRHVVQELERYLPALGDNHYHCADDGLVGDGLGDDWCIQCHQYGRGRQSAANGGGDFRSLDYHGGGFADCDYYLGV